MPPIQRPDLSRKIAKRFGLVGFGGPESISPEIVPVYQVDPPEPGEVDRDSAGSRLETASVGEFSHVMVFNPVGSGVVALVQRVESSSATTGNFTMRIRQNALTLGGDAHWRDTRIAGITDCDFGGVALGALGAGDEIWRGVNLASTQIQLVAPNPIAILAPGNGLLIAFETVNIALFAAFWWVERDLSQFTD